MHKSNHSTYGTAIALLANVVPYDCSFVMGHEYSRTKMQMTFTDPRGNSVASSGNVVPLFAFIK